MKKSLLVSVFAALAMMVSVNSFAQEKATKEDYKEIAKQEKVLNKDLQKKAIKEARKEAKKLTKEGFKTPVGKLPLDKQIENAWQKQAEMTPDGTPFWYVGASKSVISATLGRVVPLVEVYRTLDNKNVEVMVTLGYSMEAANKAAISAVRAELAKKSEDLAKELDKLGY